MEKIKTFSVTEDKKDLMDEFHKIRWREHKPFSTMVLHAIEEYTRNHKDGNDSYTLDQFDTDLMSATPAFFRPLELWKQWVMGLSETEFKKFDKRVNEFRNLSNHYFEKK